MDDKERSFLLLDVSINLSSLASRWTSDSNSAMQMEGSTWGPHMSEEQISARAEFMKSRHELVTLLAGDVRALADMLREGEIPTHAQLMEMVDSARDKAG